MIHPADFTPAWWLPGAHLQTLVPNLLPRRGVALRRERLEMPDGDFLDLDWGPQREGPLVLLLHGLAASSRSPYAAGLMRRLAQAGGQGLVMHFRGCSGEPNRLPRAYSAGETGDIAHVVDHLRRRSPDRPLALIGVSLGGNALLRWLGDPATSPGWMPPSASPCPSICTGQPTAWNGACPGYTSGTWSGSCAAP